MNAFNFLTILVITTSSTAYASSSELTNNDIN